MSLQPDAIRLNELLESLVNETIARDEHKELQTLLLHNPSLQQQYLSFMEVDTGIRLLLRESPASDAGGQGVYHARMVDLSDSAGFGSAHRGEVTAVPKVVTRTIRRVPLVVAMVMALLMTLGITLMLARPAVREFAVIEPVRLKQSAGAEMFGRQVPPVGSILEYGREFALTSGIVELTFPDGAEVILEAPSVVEIADRARLIVRAGVCSVFAPPGAEGFCVETPQAEVVDRGTRFFVHVDDVGQTNIHVVDGAADVRLKTDLVQSASERLSTGDSRRLGGDSEGDSRPAVNEEPRYRRTLPDRVVSYEARTTPEGRVDELDGVTVRRGGKNVFYPVDELIGVEVRHYCAGFDGKSIAVAKGTEVPRLSVLETDRLLNTGIINPGGAAKSLTADPDDHTPGLRIGFRQPLVNLAGPDVVVFELQTVLNPPHGDAFHVSPTKFAPGLKSLTVSRYDVTMLDAEAKPLVDFELRVFNPPPRNRDELLTLPTGVHVPSLLFRALAVGIDLSDLGYPENAVVDELFFQDAADDDRHLFDPVFIAGLPARAKSKVTP